jgi:hypothetical protein
VFSGDGKRVATASDDATARIWDAESGEEIAVLKGHALPVSSAAFIDAAQEFSDDEMDDPILRGKNDPVARNPCLRRGPLSLDYWSRLPGQFWRSTRRLIGAN